MKKHKCDGCKYKTEYQAMGFKPNGICSREHNLIQAEKSYNAEVCPFSDVNPDEMTAKEAINIILRSVVHSVKSRENLSEALFIMQKAMEKQTPKEHHHTRVVEVKCKARESVCPACLYVIITKENEYPKYCTWCGQALDWSNCKKEDKSDV